MKKVRCGGQPLTVDPAVDVNLVHKSACGSLLLCSIQIIKIMSAIVQEVLAIAM